jgi:hypothetical protein
VAIGEVVIFPQLSHNDGLTTQIRLLDVTIPARTVVLHHDEKRLRKRRDLECYYRSKVGAVLAPTTAVPRAFGCSSRQNGAVGRTFSPRARSLTS